MRPRLSSLMHSPSCPFGFATRLLVDSVVRSSSWRHHQWSNIYEQHKAGLGGAAIDLLTDVHVFLTFGPDLTLFLSPTDDSSGG